MSKTVVMRTNIRTKKEQTSTTACAWIRGAPQNLAMTQPPSGAGRSPQPNRLPEMTQPTVKSRRKFQFMVRRKNKFIAAAVSHSKI
jgi:hypothetical protein